MNKLNKWVVFLLVTLLIGGTIGSFLTYRLTKPSTEATSEINVQTILQALKPQGFLITQSVIADQKVTIDRRTGNIFKDFFLGQTITARGTMEANLGVDLTQLEDGDVEITDDQIIVRIPDVRLFNTRLIGDIEVENSQGIIKRVFQPDDGYNESLQSLTAATEALAADEHIIATARERSKEELRRLVKLLGADAKEVVIEIK